MVEYLHQAIRVSKDEEITISAIIKDEDGVSVATGATLEILDGDNTVAIVYGDYDSVNDVWDFEISKEVLLELRCGRYFYTIKQDNNSLNFKQPLYVV